MFLHLGLRELNIRDAALIMAPDEDRAKPVRRRLYLVAYLLEHIGLLKHSQKIGEYKLVADLLRTTMDAISELLKEGEFPPDSITYQLSRIDETFVTRLHSERHVEFSRVLRMKTVPADDSPPLRLQYLPEFRGIDI
jgi:hypothetical protein